MENAKNVFISQMVHDKSDFDEIFDPHAMSYLQLFAKNGFPTNFDGHIEYCISGFFSWELKFANQDRSHVSRELIFAVKDTLLSPTTKQKFPTHN